MERGLDRLPPDDASILILDDAPLTPGAQSDALLAWVRKGGVAITFAGPRIAENGTALAPAPLRRGARNLGGGCPGVAAARRRVCARRTVRATPDPRRGHGCAAGAAA
ncbi:DUF4350 domain-containing protein [Hankyongella ginsenosidimutans]|uniref:DUF4350 domain-containing protein n=1 Tax=Hankyongella ginsenosidimutans TaxID=1763828 RepID=A0A4D7C7U0_9SPHN|nr:DUF4350 domain-containing protein [Hankyongella ginsenosidimutans]QCI78763.1 DUF4350 domain-containing protein [Hankyongella ginsenosidimutans]